MLYKTQYLGMRAEILGYGLAKVIHVLTARDYVFVCAIVSG